MFFYLKAATVLDKNKNLTESQRAVLECTLNHRCMYKHFFIFALGCFSTVLLLVAVLIHQWINLFMLGLIIFNFIFAIANFVCMLHYRSEYIKAFKNTESYFGFFPKDLRKMLIKNIDTLFEGGMLPPEYVSLEWKYKTGMFLDCLSSIKKGG